MARVAFPVVALMATMAGCSGKDPYAPGEAIGTFHVTATLASSSCGDAPTPWEFDVRLRYDASTVYWVQGGAPVSGLTDRTSRAVLRSGVSETVRAADPRRNVPACILERDDTLDVVLLDAARAPAQDLGLVASLQGSLSYAFTPAEGSDCSDQTAAVVSGGYQTLPCTLQYSLTAVKTSNEAR